MDACIDVTGTIGPAGCEAVEGVEGGGSVRGSTRGRDEWSLSGLGSSFGVWVVGSSTEAVG